MSISFFKNFLITMRDTTIMFWGNNGFFYLFALAIFIILIFEKKKNKKLAYLGYTIMVIIGVYNPIIYYLCNIFFYGKYAYFTRLFSLIPVPIIISYSFVLLIKKTEGLNKLILFFLIMGIIILCGDNIYKEDWIKKADNFSKLTDDTVEISEIVHGYKDVVCLAAPTLVATEIRQFDGSIVMPYGRYIGDNENLRLLLDSEFPDVEQVCGYVGEYACDFVIVENNEVNRKNFENNGLVLFGETNNYYVFQVKNIPRIICDYNNHCQVVKKSWLNKKDELTMNDYGYATVKYEYNRRGDKVKEQYFGENDELVVPLQGYNAITYEYYKNHLLKKITYLDANSNPVITFSNFASIKYTYDSDNNKVSEYFFDENGMPYRQSIGYYGIRYGYDKDGNVIKCEYVDEKGKLINTYTGVSVILREYNENKLISERYYDNNMNLVPLISGYSGLNIEYNKSGQKTCITYLGIDNNPVMMADMYSKIRYFYNDEKKSIDEYYYDENDKPIANKDGIYGIRKHYINNRIDKIYYLDSLGGLLTSQSGYCSIEYNYDIMGNNISEYYYDQNDQPTINNMGYHGSIMRYDDRKRLEYIEYVNVDKKIATTNMGYSSVRYVYDDFGNIIKETYYNNGKDIETDNNYGEIKEYNDQNLPIKVSFIDEKGELTKTSNGYSVIKRDFDWRRHISAEYYFDKDDKPVASTEGYCGYSRESNLYDQDTSITYLDKNYKPMEIGEKNYSNVKFFYDGNHELTTKIYYNLRGEEVDRIDYQTWDIKQHSDDSNNQGLFYTLKNTVTGSLIVIDGGSTENTNHVREVINSLGGTVDAWIVTHYHEDHAGAYNAIQADPQGINIKKVYASKFDSDYEKFLEVAKYWDDPETMETWMNNSANADNVYYPDRGESITIDNLKLTFLNTYDEKLLELNGESDLPNNCALVTLIEGDEDSMLFMSDMYSSAVGDYLKQEYGDELKGVKYLQPCHHGNSIMPYDFYEFIDPDVMFFDAPEWLIEGDDWNAKGLKEWCEEKCIVTYDYRTAPNSIQFR